MDVVYIDVENHTLQYNQNTEGALIKLEESKEEIESIPSEKIIDFIKDKIQRLSI